MTQVALRDANLCWKTQERVPQMVPQAKILTFWDSFSIDFALAITISIAKISRLRRAKDSTLWLCF